MCVCVCACVCVYVCMCTRVDTGSGQPNCLDHTLSGSSGCDLAPKISRFDLDSALDHIC